MWMMLSLSGHLWMCSLVYVIVSCISVMADAIIRAASATPLVEPLDFKKGVHTTAVRCIISSLVDLWEAPVPAKSLFVISGFPTSTVIECTVKCVGVYLWMKS